MVSWVPSMCVVWCASSSSARWLMRRTHSSDNVAASRNPRARSIAVSPAVIALVMVKRGAKRSCSQLAAEGAVLERGEERVELGERGAMDTSASRRRRRRANSAEVRAAGRTESRRTS